MKYLKFSKNTNYPLIYQEPMHSFLGRIGSIFYSLCKLFFTFVCYHSVTISTPFKISPVPFVMVRGVVFLKMIFSLQRKPFLRYLNSSDQTLHRKGLGIREALRLVLFFCFVLATKVYILPFITSLSSQYNKAAKSNQRISPYVISPYVGTGQ